MKWVVLGDIGRDDFYHLGDEAMTEVAIEMLLERGASDLTLVASNPVTAETMYGHRAVQRAGFEWDMSRGACEETLAEITAMLEAEITGTTRLPEWAAAIRDAECALIAGGGNMNSQYSHLLYERLAFARVARHFGVPLLATSQTVGPVLRERDAHMVAEILDIALVFGARESHTASLLRRLTYAPEKVVHTFDDAVLLRPSDEDKGFAANLRSTAPLILASFTEDQGTSGITRDDYIERLTKLLDALASDHGAQVLLVPHAGVLGEDVEVRDQLLNREIVDRSRSGRVTAAPMLTARQCVALTESALCSVSSRYHPVVFAGQAEVAAVGVSLSTYSSVRMRGALGNVGQERFVVPSLRWGNIDEACNEAIVLAPNRSGIGSSSTTQQMKWWDALAETAASGSWVGCPDILIPETSQPDGSWSLEVEAATPGFEAWGEFEQRLSWAEQDQEFWRNRAERSENRKVVRFVDWVSRKLPGANSLR